MRPHLRYFIIPALLIMAAACAHLSVIHLEKRPWVMGQKATLTMRCWEFAYSSRLEGNKLIVSGTAKPLPDAIPEWATWIQDLWMQVYLCDDKSRVLAKDLRLYLPTQLDYVQGVPFEFHLMPEALGSSGPLNISFGYRMEVTAGRENPPGPDGKPKVFFASQGALSL